MLQSGRLGASLIYYKVVVGARVRTVTKYWFGREFRLLQSGGYGARVVTCVASQYNNFYMGFGPDMKVIQSRRKTLKVGISVVIFAVSTGDLTTCDDTD